MVTPTTNSSKPPPRRRRWWRPTPASRCGPVRAPTRRSPVCPSRSHDGSCRDPNPRRAISPTSRWSPTRDPIGCCHPPLRLRRDRESPPRVPATASTTGCRQFRTSTNPAITAGHCRLRRPSMAVTKEERSARGRPAERAHHPSTRIATWPPPSPPSPPPRREPSPPPADDYRLNL